MGPVGDFLEWYGHPFNILWSLACKQLWASKTSSCTWKVFCSEWTSDQLTIFEAEEQPGRSEIREDLVKDGARSPTKTTDQILLGIQTIYKEDRSWIWKYPTGALFAWRWKYILSITPKCFTIWGAHPSSQSATVRPKCLAALALPAVGVVAAGSRQRKSRQPLAALDVPGGVLKKNSQDLLPFLPESAGNQWKMIHVSKRNGHLKPFSAGFHDSWKHRKPTIQGKHVLYAVLMAWRTAPMFCMDALAH